MSCAPSFLEEEVKFLSQVLVLLKEEHVLTGSLAMMLTFCETADRLPPVPVSTLIEYAKHHLSNVDPDLTTDRLVSLDHLHPDHLARTYVRNVVKDIDLGLSLPNRVKAQRMLKLLEKAGYDRATFELDKPTVVLKKQVYVNSDTSDRMVDSLPKDSVVPTITVWLMPGEEIQHRANAIFVDQLTVAVAPVTDVSGDRTPPRASSSSSSSIPSLSNIVEHVVSTFSPVMEWNVPFPTSPVSWSVLRARLRAYLGDVDFDVWICASENCQPWPKADPEWEWEWDWHSHRDSKLMVVPKRPIVLDLINTDTTSATRYLPVFDDMDIIGVLDQSVPVASVPLLLHRKVDAIRNENLSGGGKTKLMEWNELRNLYDFYVLHSRMLPNF